MMEAPGGASMFADKTSATALKSLHRGAKNILYCYVGSQYSFTTAKGLNVDTSISSASKGKDVFVWWIPFLIILNVLAFIGTIDWFISIFFPQLYKKKGDVTEE